MSFRHVLLLYKCYENYSSLCIVFFLVAVSFLHHFLSFSIIRHKGWRSLNEFSTSVTAVFGWLSYSIDHHFPPLIFWKIQNLFFLDFFLSRRLIFSVVVIDLVRIQSSDFSVLCLFGSKSRLMLRARCSVSPTSIVTAPLERSISNLSSMHWLLK